MSNMKQSSMFSDTSMLRILLKHISQNILVKDLSKENLNHGMKKKSSYQNLRMNVAIYSLRELSRCLLTSKIQKI